MDSQPTVQVQLPSRPIWVDLLMMAVTLAVMGGVIVAMMPSAERQLLLMAVQEQRTRLYRGLSAKARQAGLEGMSDELAGRNPGVWYERARGLSWWRDRFGKASR